MGSTGLVPLCDLTTLSASLLDWDDLFPDSSVLQVRLTSILSALCDLTTFDLTPFLDLPIVVSTRLVPLCDHMLLADWEDLALEVESLLSLEDITGVDVARNFIIFFNPAAFSSDLMYVQ